MICLILAAGYATRLYPLTENFPKPLLEIGDKTILDHLVDDINKKEYVSEFVVISNHKFFSHFEHWSKTKDMKITVLDDGTTSNENRLGAVVDIKYAIDTLDIQDDIMVIAGDNVLDFSLNKFIEYSYKKGTSCVMRYYENNPEKIKKSGALQIDADEKVLSMQEKPEKPQSNWCCPPFYIYMKNDLINIKKAMENGCAVDAPGSLVSYMCTKTDIHAFEMPGSRYDIGNLESYEKVKCEYKGLK